MFRNSLKKLLTKYWNLAWLAGSALLLPRALNSSTDQILKPLWEFHSHHAECNTMQQQKSVQHAQCNKIHQLQWLFFCSFVLCRGKQDETTFCICCILLHWAWLQLNVTRMYGSINFLMKLWNAEKNIALLHTGVPWPSGLAHRTCVLTAESSECGFESWLQPWHLCPWARHFTVIASLHPGV